MPTRTMAALTVGFLLSPIWLLAAQTDSAQARIRKDLHPLMLVQRNRRAVAAYNYKLEFYKLPDRVETGLGKGGRHSFFREGIELPTGALKPESSISFKHRFGLFYDLNAAPHYFLVITLPLAHFSSKDPDEKRHFRETRKPTDAPWINEDGETEDLVGIVSDEGQIIYRFPVKQKNPGLLVRELVTSPDGKYAAIMIGERFQEPFDDSFPFVAKPREVWTWEYPDKLRKFPVSGKEIADLRAEYRSPPK